MPVQFDDDETVSDLLTAVRGFVTEPDVVRAPYIQTLNARLADNTQVKIPSLVFATQTEFDWIQKNFKGLAQLGLIISISTPIHKLMSRGANRAAVREMLKTITAHNDKLGVDFTANPRGYLIDHRASHPPESSYKGFITDARDHLKDSKIYKDWWTQLGLQHSSAFNNKQFLAQAKYQKIELPAKANEYIVAGRKKQFMGLDIPQFSSMSRHDLVDNELKIPGRTQNSIEQFQQFIDLDKQLSQSRDEIQQLQRVNSELEQRISGLNDMAIIDPKDLVDYPQRLRRNFKTVFSQMQDTDELLYVKSLIEPFHPSIMGVRVPSLLPRETATFNTFNQFDYVVNVDYLTIMNLELGGEVQGVHLRTVPSMYTSVPFNAEAIRPGLNEKYYVNYIPTGHTNTQAIKDALTVVYNDTIPEFFVKQRVVSSGIRFFKTSTSDNESGNLDLYYSRDGAAVDEHSALQQLFGRPTDESERIYLAGSPSEIRGRAGFVAQCNFRPYDDQSYVLRDSSFDKVNALYNDDVSPVWFLSITTKELYTAFELQNLPVNSTNQAWTWALVVESLQQRHTFLARVQNRAAGLQLTAETTYHLEGIPEQHKYGFIQRGKASLISVDNPRQLIVNIPTDAIFSDYYMRRGDLLDRIMSNESGQLKGLWSDTLFPKIKELIKYGADQMSSDPKKIDHFVDAALDTALATLSVLAPELAPAMVVARKMASKPIKNQVEHIRQAVKDWAVSGQHQYAIQYDDDENYEMIDTRSKTSAIQHHASNLMSKN